MKLLQKAHHFAANTAIFGSPEVTILNSNSDLPSHLLVTEPKLECSGNWWNHYASAFSEPASDELSLRGPLVLAES